MQVKVACLKDKEIKMSESPVFFMKIAKATSPPEKGAGMMSIIIRRRYALLERMLCSTFEGQKDVKVTIDKRYGERRTRTQLVELERRHADRRRPKEDFVEVSLSA